MSPFEPTFESQWECVAVDNTFVHHWVLRFYTLKVNWFGVRASVLDFFVSPENHYVSRRSLAGNRTVKNILSRNFSDSFRLNMNSIRPFEIWNNSPSPTSFWTRLYRSSRSSFLTETHGSTTNGTRSSKTAVCDRFTVNGRGIYNFHVILPVSEY